MPENVQWTRSGKWVNVPIVGRNHSKKNYTGGEDRLSFTMDFKSLYENDREEAMRRMAWLQSLAYNDGLNEPARNVKLVWGRANIFRHKIWIVKSVKSNMGEFRSNFNFYSTRILITIELELDPEENLRIDQVRNFSPAGTSFNRI